MGGYVVLDLCGVFVADASGAREVATPWLPACTASVELVGRGYEVLLSRETVVRPGETVLVDLSK